ncbi:hypothetical protein Y919_05075 [Caloranaerobacter azorensis H53214]|uniref:Helicase C-terminal domain-containing protein n=1 Tax=Caloranaerobacter azorensis H53214 TaxID=1156417 RepID=A0A096BID1_9FIRM|nr:hypothetical protein [Caloranaerobacter azorensis]KGG80607.1 hypothetical protein Y919_05075 [Caloranaerobacter azorensis H53214]
MCKYVNDNNEVKGYGVGIFLEDEYGDYDKIINRILNGINCLNLMDIDRIFLYRIDLLNSNSIKFVQQEYNIKVCDGRELKCKVIIYALKKLLKEKYDLFRDKEILIISDNTDLSRDIVFEIAKEFKYVTVLGEDEKFVIELEDYILNETGLSIYTAQFIKKLNKYNIIVNLNSKLNLNVSDIYSNSIIFDFSIERVIFKEMSRIGKKAVVITDFIFKMNQNIKSIPSGYEFNKEIPSYFYQSIQMFNSKDLVKVEINDKRYRFKEARKIIFGHV